MVRTLSAGIVVALVGFGAASAQSQRRAATLDDVVMELQAMRADMNRAATASQRAQLVAARMTLQEVRLSSAAQQLASVREQLAESRLRLAPSTDQVKPALETNSQILAPLRYTLHEEQQRTRELRAQEAELSRLLEAEEQRWLEFNTRLDDLERALDAQDRRTARPNP